LRVTQDMAESANILWGRGGYAVDCAWTLSCVGFS
jgi:hypothetical protein